MHPRFPHLLPVLLTAAVLLLPACAGQQADEGATPEMTDPQPTVQPALPDTTAEAVWAYLQAIDYEQDWPMWPGKTAFYAGTEPHGMLLTTYLNDRAHAVVANEMTTLPDSSFLIKENYTPDSTLVATTIMYKVPGYDPEHNDWFWAKYGSDGAVQAAGRVESCQTCHQMEDDANFVRTDPL